MKGFRTTSLNEGAFQINMKKDMNHTFRGKVGNDDDVTRDPRLMLKYTILDDSGVEDQP
jgi:hypothetical protein